MTQAEFESIERVARLAERLEGVVRIHRPARGSSNRWRRLRRDRRRRRKTHLEADAGRKVLHVADNAHTDDILNAARCPARKAPTRPTLRLAARGSRPPRAAIRTVVAAPITGGDALKVGTTDVVPQFRTRPRPDTQTDRRRRRQPGSRAARSSR